MALYVYAIASGELRDPVGSGLGERPLRAVRTQRLSAVVSDCSGPLSAAREDDLWRHEEVVEALMGGEAILPVRYGTVIEGEEPLRELLRAREHELLTGLQRVAGAVELSVRAAWSASADAPADAREHASGTEYLRAARERDRRAAELRERIQRELAPLARESCVRRGGSVGHLSIAYLVGSERTPEFHARIAALADAGDEVQIACTGPWPPYSFAAAPGAIA